MSKINYNHLKLNITVLIMLVFSVFLLLPTQSKAASNNIFVEDYAEILTEQDQETIKNINEEKFATLPGKPQYAVVTLKNLDGYDSIEDYATEKFEHLGIGKKELNNGFLFVISIGDRKYRLETGYGVEDVITDSMKSDVITDKVMEILDDGDYRQAVMAVSKSVESIVMRKYGDYEASKQAVIAEKENKQKLVNLFIRFCCIILGIFVIVILIYKLKIIRTKRFLAKHYLSNEIKGYVYQTERVNLGITLPAKVENVTFVDYLSKKIKPLSQSKQMLSETSDMQLKVMDLFLEDVVIQYWRHNKQEAIYDISIYLDPKNLPVLKETLKEKVQIGEWPLQMNPLLSLDYLNYLRDYMKDVTDKHRYGLKVSGENQYFVQQMVQNYMKKQGVSFKSELDNELEISLMAYYFLKDEDLSNPNLVKQLAFSGQNFENAYRFAENKRKEIDSSKRQEALDDLTHMTLGSYYLQALIWSSYSHDDDSFFGGGGSGGGSSFGGGSSGGGGFSGGW